MDSIKVHLSNKHKKIGGDMIYSGVWERGLYCWEFTSDILEPDKFYYKTKKSLYRLFLDSRYGYWIGRSFLIPNSKTESHEDCWFSVEKELGAVYCETLKGRFYWK